jgi:small subunit ribosomal protein S3
MGQKTHPIGFRLGVNRTWSSSWYIENANSKYNYASVLHQDIQLRKYIKNYFLKKNFIIDEPTINRKHGKIQILVNLFDISLKSSNIINNLLKKRLFKINLIKKLEIENLIKTVNKVTSCQVSLKLGFVKTIKKYPISNARILAEFLSKKMKARKFNVRKSLKIITNLIKRKNSLVNGIAIKISGRIRGKARAKSMFIKEGKIALQSLNTKIDYSLAKVITKFGVVGIKVWIAIKPRVTKNYIFK